MAKPGTWFPFYDGLVGLSQLSVGEMLLFPSQHLLYPILCQDVTVYVSVSLCACPHVYSLQESSFVLRRLKLIPAS